MITHACVKFYTKSQSYDNGVVPSTCYTIPCHRHGDAFAIIAQFIESDEIDKTKTEQGFLTETGKFLNRHEARLHAIACGQVPFISTTEILPDLYSEDLW